MGRIFIAALGALSFLLAFPLESAAYIGPGAGLTAFGTVLAVIGTALLAIVGFVWYPVKRFWARRKKARPQEGAES